MANTSLPFYSDCNGRNGEYSECVTGACLRTRRQVPGFHRAGSMQLLRLTYPCCDTRHVLRDEWTAFPKAEKGTLVHGACDSNCSAHIRIPNIGSWPWRAQKGGRNGSAQMWRTCQQCVTLDVILELSAPRPPGGREVTSGPAETRSYSVR